MAGPQYTATERQFTSTGRLLKKIGNRYNPSSNLRLMRIQMQPSRMGFTTQRHSSWTSASMRHSTLSSMAPSPRPVQLFGDPGLSEVLAVEQSGRCAMFDLNGHATTPVMPFRVPGDARVCFVPSKRLVVIGGFAGRIDCFDMAGRDALWSKIGFNRLDGLSSCEETTVFVRQLNGRTTELDAYTGVSIAETEGVCSHASDSHEARVLTLKKHSRREKSGVLELWTSLTKEPLFSIEIAIDSIGPCVFDRNTVILSEPGIATIRCLDNGGTQQWHRNLPPNRYILCLSLTPDHRSVFAIERGTQGTPEPHGLLLDRSTGLLRERRPIPLAGVFAASADGSSAVVALDGILTVPDLAWRPITFYFPK